MLGEFIGGFIGLAVIVIIVVVLLADTLFVVKQQHAVIIERLGRFNKIVGSGLHAKIPFIDRKAATVSLRTMKNGFDIDAKTEDNVTIGLEVSAQYHVSYEMGAGPADSGVYKSYYMLQQPVAQIYGAIQIQHKQPDALQQGFILLHFGSSHRSIGRNFLINIAHLPRPVHQSTDYGTDSLL